jgi:purine-binding chemotaxis protein CheW
MQETMNIETNVEEIIQMVSFKLGEEDFGIDIFKVREINKMMEITKVPNAPSYVEGVVNLRGKVTPIIDLRKRLGLPEREDQSESNIVEVDIEDKAVGLIVDSVEEVLRIPSNITEEPPELATGINSEFITSVAKLEDRLLILLDLERLLSDKEQENLDKLT